MDYEIRETRREDNGDGSVTVYDDHLWNGALPGPEWHDVPRVIWPAGFPVDPNAPVVLTGEQVTALSGALDTMTPLLPQVQEAKANGDATAAFALSLHDALTALVGFGGAA